MKNNQVKSFYRQRLPHIQRTGAIFFVTFRLYDSIPKIKLIQLTEEYETKVSLWKKNRKSSLFNIRKKYFAEYDSLLDNVLSGPTFLKQKAVAEIVAEQINRFDGEFYDLLAYTIMSNHVHLLIDTSIQIPLDIEDMNLVRNYKNLDVILKRIKGSSARYANKFLNRKDQFWERESFDMYIRNEQMLDRVTSYILNNPVKANLVSDWQLYTWNYLKYKNL